MVGDVVTFFAHVVKTGRTSITVDVEVHATRNPHEEITVKVTEATLTYVAVGPDRRPRALPAETVTGRATACGRCASSRWGGRQHAATRRRASGTGANDTPGQRKLAYFQCSLRSGSGLRKPVPKTSRIRAQRGNEQSKNSEEKTMKTPNFRRHHVAAAVAGAVLALGATQALATGFQLNEQSASGDRQRVRRRRRVHRRHLRDVVEPRRAVEVRAAPVRAGPARRRAEDRVQQRRFGARAQSAARRQRRGCRRLELHPEPVRQHADQQPVRVRAGRERPVRQQDPVQRRLARPLPGARLEDHHDQRQPRVLVEGHARVQRRRRRELPVHRRQVHEQRQLFGRDGLGGCRGGRRRPDPRGARAADRRRDGRPRQRGGDHCRRHRVGLEHRRGLGRDAGLAPRRGLPFGDQVQPQGQRRLQQPDGYRAAPACAGDQHAGQRASTPEASTPAASPRTSRCRRSRTCRPCGKSIRSGK